MRRDAGLSLIELAVAVLVLSIAVVGLFRVFDAALFNAASQRDRVLALMVAQNRAEEIALGFREGPSELRLAGRDWTIESQSRATQGGFVEVTLLVTPVDGGAGAMLTTYASGPWP